RLRPPGTSVEPPCASVCPTMAPASSKLTRVCIYTRTSSQANVGDSKDSESRQVRCCQNYARPNKLVAKACDIFHECISGTEDLQTRPTFNRMIDHCYKNNGGYFDHSVRGQYPPGAGRHCPGDGGPVVD
ncbi:unnamed protein product, partial [Prorocentrum cordatum]